MSYLLRYAIVLALSFCFGGSSANSQTTTATKTPTNTVSGRVTVQRKGAPGIVVGIRRSDFSPQTAPALKATTDQHGNYQITNIPPGSYQVLPIAPAYVHPEQVFSRARGTSLMLGEGEDVSGIDFSLVRGAVITGKIVDTEGRPIIEERVIVAIADQPGQGSQRYQPVASEFQSDDRGIYRIYGLPAGRYKVSVGVADEDDAPIRFGRAAYKRTFYPDATEEKDAKVVQVTEGTEAANIDITVGRKLPRFVASGKVVDGETGQPVVGLRFGLRRMIDDREGNFVQGIFAASNSQGEFRLEGVTPGKYGVFTTPQAGSEVRADAVFFEIVDHDVTGLLLKTDKGLSLTGTVVLDGTYDKSVFAKLAQLRLRGYVQELSASGQESPINADGSFRIGGLAAGNAYFWLIAQDGRPSASFKILRVERDGIAKEHVEIKPGEQVSGVKVIASYGTASIRGEVRLENGPLPRGGRMAVWLKKLGETESNLRPHNLDARGHFLIEGIAAGNYELNVNAYIPGRREHPAANQSITIEDGTVSNIIVVLNLANPGINP